MTTHERTRRTRKGSGSHNRSTAQNVKLGRKGGKAKVPKGFALMDEQRLKEVTSQGGQARAAQRSLELQTVVRGTTEEKEA